MGSSNLTFRCDESVVALHCQSLLRFFPRVSLLHLIPELPHLSIHDIHHTIVSLVILTLCLLHVIKPSHDSLRLIGYALKRWLGLVWCLRTWRGQLRLVRITVVLLKSWMDVILFGPRWLWKVTSLLCL